MKGLNILSKNTTNKILISLNLILIILSSFLLYKIDSYGKITNSVQSNFKEPMDETLINDLSVKVDILESINARYSELGYYQIIEIDNDNPKNLVYKENIHNISVSFPSDYKYAIIRNSPTVKDFQGNGSSGIKIGLNDKNPSTLIYNFSETELNDYKENIEYIYVGMDSSSYNTSGNDINSDNTIKEEFTSKQGISGTLTINTVDDKILMTLSLGNIYDIGYVSCDIATYDNERDNIIEVLKSIELSESTYFEQK